MAFAVISGATGNECVAARDALSIVHPRERIGVPARSIRSIEAREERALLTSTGGTLIVRSPNVELCFAPEIHHRINRLSQEWQGSTINFVVDGETVLSVVLQEPLTSLTSVAASFWDLADAEEIARRLRAKWRRPDLWVVARSGA